MDAVLVEDVVIVRGPVGFEECHLSLELLGTHLRRAEVDRDLRPVAEHRFHYRHRAALDVVRVKVLDSMDADAHVWDERQLLRDGRGEHAGERPADLVDRCHHTCGIALRRSGQSRNLIDIPQLLQEAGALRWRGGRIVGTTHV